MYRLKANALDDPVAANALALAIKQMKYLRNLE